MRQTHRNSKIMTVAAALGMILVAGFISCTVPRPTKLHQGLTTVLLPPSRWGVGEIFYDTRRRGSYSGYRYGIIELTRVQSH